MKWFNKICILFLLLVITASSTNSNNVEKVEDSPRMFIDTLEIPKVDSLKNYQLVRQEIKVVKNLLRESNKDLKELKELIEERKEQDLILIETYANQ